jgi:ketosteroid isomerase-like protein
MSAAQNKQLMQRVFSELAAGGDSRPFAAILAEDIRWTVIGNAKSSGTYEGKQSVLEKLMAPLFSRIVDHIQVTPKRFIAEDDYVVVEFTGKSTTVEGKPYNNTYCWVHRLADGMVTEVTEYLDTELVTSAFGPR